jgi:hypothetical protein
MQDWQRVLEGMQIHPEAERCDLASFFKAAGAEFAGIPEKYLQMVQILGLRPTEIASSIPKRTLEECNGRNKASFEEISLIKENLEFLESFKIIRRFQHSLVSPRIDSSKLSDVIACMEHQGLRDKSHEFMPGPDGFAEKTVYSNSNTVTGRLTVISGPNPLVMVPSVKDCIVSSHKNGSILQLDLSAAEPRTALNLLGKNIDGDLYEHLAAETMDSSVSRAVAKQAVICALYGQSPKNLNKLLPQGLEATDVIRKVKAFFEYERLLSIIKSTSFEPGKIRNAIYRPIALPKDYTENLLLSYYLQSSVADISILLFDSISNRLSGYMKPIYIIHDALIVDCNEECAEYLNGRNTINLRHNEWNYPVKVSSIQCG